MRTPRINIRSLMALVALVALAVWGESMWLRSVKFTKIARKHKSREGDHCGKFHDALRYYRQSSTWYPHLSDAQIIEGDNKLKMHRRSAAYEESMRRKYQRAARYPWFHVAPDPVAPPVVPEPTGPTVAPNPISAPRNSWRG